MSEASVVLDTNVFVAAGFNPHSGSARVIEEVRTGDLKLVWHEATRSESKAVVEQIPPLSWEPFATLFREEKRYEGGVDLQDIDYVPDPTDRKFAALAKATDATLITNDQDLLVNRDQANVYIVAPDEFLARRR